MQHQDDTIAAISTPCAQGGIGIIRISGPKAKNIAKIVFHPAKKSANIFNLSGFSGLFGHVVRAGKVVDEAILLNFNSPKSYTGEDVVELSVHSGPFILREVLRSVLESGARLAEPGEFTRRAFLNNKLNLTQAEAVIDLISANNNQAHAAALELKQGALSNKIQKITKLLLAAVGHISATLDYPEDEIETLEISKLQAQILEIECELKILIKTYDIGKILREGVLTTIVGKPNVGKSTLMNLLSGCNKSIVTPIPGTTRDLVEETINLEGITLRLADTAGIHKTQDVVEQMGIELALKRLDQSALVIAIFDVSVPLERYDLNLIEKLTGKEVIAVLNKADLGNIANTTLIKEKFKCVVEGSALKADLLFELSQIIKSKIGTLSTCGCILANERQRNCVNCAITSLQEALAALKLKKPLDIINIILENALDSLYEITGQNVTSSVIDDIFSRFCVGK